MGPIGLQMVRRDSVVVAVRFALQDHDGVRVRMVFPLRSRPQASDRVRFGRVGQLDVKARRSPMLLSSSLLRSSSSSGRMRNIWRYSRRCALRPCGRLIPHLLWPCSGGGYLWLYTQILLPFIAQQTLRSDLSSANPADLSVNMSHDSSEAQFSLDMSL